MKTLSRNNSSNVSCDMNHSFIPYRLAAKYLQDRLVEKGLPFPAVGIICGSGLSELAQTLQDPVLTIQYADIPCFPKSCTVAGHHGEVVFGNLNGVYTMCFRGRFHAYEGHDMKTVVLPVNVMRCLQVKIVIVTNAAGGLNPDYRVGDVLAISDHLALPQLVGNNPLMGPNDDELGPRFPATSNAYNEHLRSIAQKAAQSLQFDFVRPRGTYCYVSGPMYESKAECRFLRQLGGDAVGMSTIPEVVVAHHCDMQVLCLSLITNQVVMEGDEGAPVATHAEVLEAVSKRSKQMQALVKEIVGLCRLEVLPKLPPLRQVSLVVPHDCQKEYMYERKSNNGGHHVWWQHPLLWIGVPFFVAGMLIGSLD
jgi:purine-nucleoside phosphorylase